MRPCARPIFAEAERALAALAEADLGDHLTFRLIRSTPTGLGENQPGVATRRYVFACIDADHDTGLEDLLWYLTSGTASYLRTTVVARVSRAHCNSSAGDGRLGLPKACLEGPGRPCGYRENPSWPVRSSIASCGSSLLSQDVPVRPVVFP